MIKMVELAHTPQEPYQYDALPSPTSFRIVELLPGREGNRISCRLHPVDWSEAVEFEAISYSWGDPNATGPVECDGKQIVVTENLHVALTHLRYSDRSRMLWVDALW